MGYTRKPGLADRIGPVKDRVQRILNGTFTPTDSDALLKSMIAQWGGTDALARDIYQEYQDATAGGMTRQRILEMVQRLIINNTNESITKVRTPNQMSDAELEVEATRLLERIAKGNQDESRRTAAAEAWLGQTQAGEGVEPEGS